jgi:hypothetical protein
LTPAGWAFHNDRQAFTVFSLPGIFLLVSLIYVRPQEFIEVIRPWPLLYVALGLMIFGLLLDLRLRLARPLVPPQLGIIVAFFAWCVVALALRFPEEIGRVSFFLGIPVALCLAIAVGVQTFRAFELVAGLMLALALFLAGAGVYQNFAPLGCHYPDPTSEDAAFIYDGRPCNEPDDCKSGDADPDTGYICEHTGLFNTTPIIGRVRYRGVFNDPNDLALAISMSLPFAFAFAARRQSALRILVLVVSLGLIGLCTVFTKSRGGQGTFLTVVCIYVYRRYGWRGLVAAAVAGLPVILLGGRSGEEAEESFLGRVEAWQEGLIMFRSWPILGVGQGHFLDHHFRTAHSSFVLAIAELGFPGLVVWSSMLYLSMKIPLLALRHLENDPREAPEVARIWAKALLASLAGLLVGSSFLSFAYHVALWILVGMTGAFAVAIRRHEPDWRITFGRSDLVNVIVIDIVAAVGIYVYVRLKLGGIL